MNRTTFRKKKKKKNKHTTALAPPPEFARGQTGLSAALAWRTRVPGGSAEIGAVDGVHARLFVTGATAVEVLDLTDGRPLAEIPYPAGYSATSVACFGGVAAFALAADDRSAAGTIEFYDGQSLERLASFPAGFNPDMVVFAASGRRLVCADEGEPTDDYAVDPEGSVTVIDLPTDASADDWARGVVRRMGFEQFNDQRDQLRRRGVRIFGPSHVHADGQATVAEDLEPEFIALNRDGTRAWATLQENNAIAEIDLDAGRVTAIHPLGLKSFAAPTDKESSGLFGLDASDLDGGLRIRPLPVAGMNQPDPIAVVETADATYLITANEGDPRRYGGFDERCTVDELPGRGVALDPRLTKRLASVETGGLDRLVVSIAAGDEDGDCDLDQLCCFGGRSLAVWRVEPEGALRQVFDSGCDFERILGAETPERYRPDGSGERLDLRSPHSGPEPEGLVLAAVGRRRFACVGLERAGGVMIYEATDPERPTFSQYLPPQGNGEEGYDVAPEGLAFIDAANSPCGAPLLLVCNEVSGTVTAYRLAVE
mgnify:CR=1 FL=1